MQLEFGEYEFEAINRYADPQWKLKKLKSRVLEPGDGIIVDDPEDDAQLILEDYGPGGDYERVSFDKATYLNALRAFGVKVRSAKQRLAPKQRFAARKRFVATHGFVQKRRFVILSLATCPHFTSLTPQ